MQIGQALETVQSYSFTMLPVRHIDFCCPVCQLTLSRDSATKVDTGTQLNEELLPWHADIDKTQVHKITDTVLMQEEFVSDDRYDAKFILGTCPQCRTKYQIVQLWLTSRPTYNRHDDKLQRSTFCRPDQPIHAADIRFYIMHDNSFFFHEWTMTRFTDPVISEPLLNQSLTLDCHQLGPFEIVRQGVNFEKMSKLVSAVGKRWLSLVGKELTATL